jgi:hypothetical protein
MISKIYVTKIKKEFLRLAILSLIIVLIWLAMTTYRALNKSQTPPDVKKQLLPLTTSLPIDTIEQVAGRLDSPPIDWGSLNLAAPEILVVEPAQESTSSSTASPSGELEESSSASPSGELNND